MTEQLALQVDTARRVRTLDMAEADSTICHHCELGRPSFRISEGERVRDYCDVCVELVLPFPLDGLPVFNSMPVGF